MLLLSIVIMLQLLLFMDRGALVSGFLAGHHRMVPSIQTVRGSNHGGKIIVNVRRGLHDGFNRSTNRKRRILHRAATSNEVLFDRSFDSVMNLSRLYNRASWISWWIQIILSVISGVILTFANTVRQSSNKNIAFLWNSGFAFSSVGVLLAFLNALWTWNITVLTRRISLKKLVGRNALQSLKRYSRISVAMSLIGMFFSLIGAEQIVGTLASKILSSPGLAFSPLLTTGTAAASPFQAVDIFLVQANTNALVAHFASLVCYIILQTQLPPQDSRSEKPSTALSSDDNSTNADRQ